MKTKKIFWKAVFLLMLFILGIMLGINLNKTKMELIQQDKDNTLTLENMKECCTFTDLEGATKVCKSLSNYGCDECYEFCDGRTE
tara:strand:+ start:2826 stop:3080 length:255 start_codon:yes stop_codon:yes gene_type:complete